MVNRGQKGLPFKERYCRVCVEAHRVEVIAGKYCLIPDTNTCKHLRQLDEDGSTETVCYYFPTTSFGRCRYERHR